MFTKNVVQAGSDTDTSSNGISVGDWISEFWADDRAENNLGLEPEDVTGDGQFTFSRQDCIDDITFDLVITLNETGQTAADGRDLYIYAGEDCDESITDCVVVSEVTNTSVETIRINDLEFTELFNGIDCDVEGGKNLELYIALLENANYFDEENGDYMNYAGLAVFDNVAPGTNVKITDVLVGNDNLEVKFDADPSSSVAGFAAIYVTSTAENCTDGLLVEGAIPDATIQTIDSKDAMSRDENSIKVSGLENGSSYQVAVVTLDSAGNPSVLSAPVCATPQESVGIGESLNTDGQFCYVATAAFGSYDHPTVRVLRVFRDRFLRELPLGDTIVAAYYAVGPTLAGWTGRDANIRLKIQHALGLFAGGSTILVQWGTLWVMLGFWSALMLGLLLGFTAPRTKEK